MAAPWENGKCGSVNPINSQTQTFHLGVPPLSTIVITKKYQTERESKCLLKIIITSQTISTEKRKDMENKSQNFH